MLLTRLSFIILTFAVLNSSLCSLETANNYFENVTITINSDSCYTMNAIIELGPDYRPTKLRFNYIDMLNLKELRINYICYKIVTFEHLTNRSKDVFLDVCAEKISLNHTINPNPNEKADPKELDICGQIVLYHVVKGTNYTKKFDCFKARDCHLLSCGKSVCSDNGKCENGICRCYPGYYGYQCNIYSPQRNYYVVAGDTIKYEGDVNEYCDILNISVNSNVGNRYYSLSTRHLSREHIKLKDLDSNSHPSLRSNCTGELRIGNITEMYEDFSYYVYSCAKMYYVCNNIGIGEILLKCEDIARNQRCATKKVIVGTWLGISWYYWVIIFTFSTIIIAAVIFLNIKVRLRRIKLKKFEEEEEEHQLLVETQ